MNMRDTIETKLRAALQPAFIEVIDESANHSRGSETHFKVTIAADEFQGQRLLQRHRRVNTVLAAELGATVHALAMHTYATVEWREREALAPASPQCAHGTS